MYLIFNFEKKISKSYISRSHVCRYVHLISFRLTSSFSHRRTWCDFKKSNIIRSSRPTFESFDYFMEFCPCISPMIFKSPRSCSENLYFFLPILKVEENSFRSNAIIFWIFSISRTRHSLWLQFLGHLKIYKTYPGQANRLVDLLGNERIRRRIASESDAFR